MASVVVYANAFLAIYPAWSQPLPMGKLDFSNQIEKQNKQSKQKLIIFPKLSGKKKNPYKNDKWILKYIYIYIYIYIYT